MNKLTKEQVKAFIDDLAYVYHKHSLHQTADRDGMEFICPNDTYHEFVCATYTERERMWTINFTNRFARKTICDEILESIDPRELSAHEKIEKEAGLRG